MKNFIYATPLALSLATTAIAGSLETPVIEAPVVMAATSAPDWSGFYAGGMASADGGTRTYEDPPGSDPHTTHDYEDLTSYGGFAGYNVQNGSLVYGGEVAYNAGGNLIIGFPDSPNTFIADFKARAGYSVGDALIYGVAAYSMTEWSTTASYAASGFSYGAGIDFLVGDHLFIGAEYLARSMSSPRADDPDLIGTANIDSAQLRVGWKF